MKTITKKSMIAGSIVSGELWLGRFWRVMDVQKLGGQINMRSRQGEITIRSTPISGPRG